MKKFVILLCALVSTLNLFAGPIKVKEGSAAFLKSEGTVCFSFDWSGCMWNYDEKTLKEHWGGDYAQYVSGGEAAFADGYQQKAKKTGRYSSDPNTADYLCKIKMTNMDRKFSPLSLIPSHKYMVWATVTVTERASGKTVCVFDVKKFEGGGLIDVYESYCDVMRDFGYNLARQK